MTSKFIKFTCHSPSKDAHNIVMIVNQGIDARLEAFTLSHFESEDGRLACYFHVSEIQILLRRLIELSNEDADFLVDWIVGTVYTVY